MRIHLLILTVTLSPALPLVAHVTPAQVQSMRQRLTQLQQEFDLLQANVRRKHTPLVPAGDAHQRPDVRLQPRTQPLLPLVPPPLRASHVPDAPVHVPFQPTSVVREPQPVKQPAGVSITDQIEDLEFEVRLQRLKPDDDQEKLRALQRLDERALQLVERASPAEEKRLEQVLHSIQRARQEADEAQHASAGMEPVASNLPTIDELEARLRVLRASDDQASLLEHGGGAGSEEDEPGQLMPSAELDANGAVGGAREAIPGTDYDEYGLPV